MPSLPLEIKILLILAKNWWKIEIKTFPYFAISHKTRVCLRYFLNDRGSTVVKASNEIVRGQSISRDLLTYSLTFSKCVTGAGIIVGLHKDISFQCFTRTSVVTWTTSTWIWLTSQELWQETKKVANFDNGNWSYIITRWGIFSILNSGDVSSNVTWRINFTDTLAEIKWKTYKQLN